jgi:hypothetical protein
MLPFKEILRESNIIFVLFSWSFISAFEDCLKKTNAEVYFVVQSVASTSELHIKRTHSEVCFAFQVIPKENFTSVFCGHKTTVREQV